MVVIFIPYSKYCNEICCVVHSQNGDKRHVHNGDKLKRRNTKRRQETVGLCEAFKQLFCA